MAFHSRTFCDRAFTLIELLIVLAIIALLFAMLLPALNKSNEAARNAICLSNLHGIGTATGNYCADNKQWLIHGWDRGFYPGFGPQTGMGFFFHPTCLYDDDWGDARPGTPGHNPSTNGAQNICGVGQLMYDNYLSERPEAIACPQSNYAEPGQPADSLWSKLDDVRGYFKSYAPSASGDYWRNEYWDSGVPTWAGYVHCTSYVVRGPQMRMDDKNVSSKTALFTDRESMNYTLIPLVPVNGSPLKYGWGRTHRDGTNTVYADGSASMFRDPDRSITYWSHIDTRYSGNGYALMSGTLDR